MQRFENVESAFAPDLCINLATPLPARSNTINLLVAASFKHKVSKVDRPFLKILFKS